jgi:hypothetical protein
LSLIVEVGSSGQEEMEESGRKMAQWKTNEKTAAAFSIDVRTGPEVSPTVKIL